MIRSTSSAHDGRSSITPATCPEAITPRSVRPSTIADFSSIGVFAASRTWLQVRSLPCLMARPSRTICGQVQPGQPAEAAARRTACRSAARTAGVLQGGHQVRAQHAVREAVHRPGHRDVPDRRRQIARLHRVRHRRVRGQQEPCAHGDARRPVGQRRDQAPSVEEAARRHHRDVHRVHHLRQQHGRRHLAGVPAALPALHDHRVRAPRRDLLGVPARPDGGDDDDPRLLQLRDQLPRRARARRTRPAPPPRP